MEINKLLGLAAAGIIKHEQKTLINKTIKKTPDQLKIQNFKDVTYRIGSEILYYYKENSISREEAIEVLTKTIKHLFNDKVDQEINILIGKFILILFDTKRSNQKGPPWLARLALSLLFHAEEKFGKDKIKKKKRGDFKLNYKHAINALSKYTGLNISLDNINSHCKNYSKYKKGFRKNLLN